MLCKWAIKGLLEQSRTMPGGLSSPVVRAATQGKGGCWGWLLCSATQARWTLADFPLIPVHVSHSPLLSPLSGKPQKKGEMAKGLVCICGQQGEKSHCSAGDSCHTWVHFKVNAHLVFLGWCLVWAGGSPVWSGVSYLLRGVLPLCT